MGETFAVQIPTDEKNPDLVSVDAANKAMDIIKGIVGDIEVGAIFEGKVTRTMAFGAFVEYLPGKEGMVHISKLAKHRVEKTEDVVKVGDIVTAKCIGIDDKGRVKMSMRAAARDRKAAEAAAQAE